MPPFPSIGAPSWLLRLAALALAVGALQLPINDLFRYALLLLAAVAIFAGTVTSRPLDWAAAAGVVLLAMAGQHLMPAPRIDEGHNVFVVDGRGGALERGLPVDAFRLMLAEFDVSYPPERRCDPAVAGCWRRGGMPERAYAFSADGIYERAPYSRRITDINFSDPVWHRIGAINESYNWFGPSDLQRNKREKWWHVLHPWRLDMPYFVMLRFPADFAGSQLCWQGKVLWEAADQRFTVWRHVEPACRIIESHDAGRMVFGLSIGMPLSMSLNPTATIQLRRLIEPGLALIGVGAVLMLLVHWQRRALALPFVLMGLALVVVLLNDSSFIGGVRPFDGGDDGLFYESVGRQILQHALAGDFARALEGGESVFYYGGPGLRYFRALEHAIFGDSFLGYLSLMLLMPVVVFAVFARFFTTRAALALTLIFVAIPVGALFGTTFFQYAKWAGRGFADPAAAIAFLAGLVVLIGATATGPSHRFVPAAGAGLLFALALWLRPNLAPAAAVLLGGAGLAALWQQQFARLAGLCIGFLPVFGMALHNWVFGGVFVLFSANATIAEAIPMPPSAYLAALGELLRLDVIGEHVRRGVLQLARWLSGPSESFLMIPLHIAAVAVLVRVAFWGRALDPWLRLNAGAMLVQHPVAWFYLSYGRYYYLVWFLTLLVCAVWMRDEALVRWREASPHSLGWFERHPARAWLARGLDRWMRLTGLAPRA